MSSSVSPQFRHFVLTSVMLAAAACGGGGEGGTQPATSVASVGVTPVDQPIERTASVQLVATPRDASGAALQGKTFTWSSSNPGVATVDASTGLLTAVNRGQTTITATTEGKSGITDVTVQILYRSITTGNGFSCDLGSIGIATCWGYNGFQDGRLGNGPLDNASLPDSPVPVDVLGGQKFTQIVSGAYHSCGITAAGAGYCWGHNSSTGKLGTGTDIGWAHQPVPVAGGLTFKAISAGFNHSCGVTTAGAAYCWGENGSGQLGTGNQTQSNAPVAVVGGITFASISAGQSQGTNNVTCGVATDGKGYCWGSDAYGEIGDGGDVSFNSTDIRTSPTLVAGALTFKDIRVGTRHVCGVLSNDTGVCWGDNAAGQLGVGTKDDTRSAPTSTGSTTFLMIDPGDHNTCGVTTAYAIYCWGANTHGEGGTTVGLGDITMVPSPGPSGEWSEVSAGGTSLHTCAISRDRLTVKCFGRNEYGQLGNGTTTNTNIANATPQQVTGQQP